MKPTNFSHFQKSFLKNKKILTDTIFSLIIFLIMLLIISNPTRFSNSTVSGLNLFFTAVLPGLFPFMLLTKLLTEIGLIFKLTKKCNSFSNKLFGTSGLSLYAFFMSILSGYPIGSKIISDLYDKNYITETEAKRMSIFCTTSGPIFIIGAVGTQMFGDFKIGIFIYISHILSSVMLGIIYNVFSKKNNLKQSTQNLIIEANPTENIFSHCINQTINSLFIVAAYITIFYLITELLETLNIFKFLSNTLFLIFRNFNISHSQCKSIIYGLLEVTRGCKSFSTDISILSTALTSGIISFSGLSIIMQSMSFLKNTKIKMHWFIKIKLMHSIISILLCFLLLTLFV